jgi:hypothetical protein
MKATTQRLTLLVGLLLLSLLVLALAVPAAQASLVSGSGAGGGGVQPTVTEDSWSAMPATSAVIGGQASRLAQIQQDHGFRASTPAGSGTIDVAQTASSSSTSSTTWLVGAAAVVLIAAIGTWALLRRRRRPAASGSAAYCRLHPEDSLCRAV